MIAIVHRWRYSKLLIMCMSVFKIRISVVATNFLDAECVSQVIWLNIYSGLVSWSL